MSQVYRITVQKMNADGTLGELVEILETERETWTSVFDFCDDYRREMASSDDLPEPSHDDSVKFCPDCERPNQFGELCPTCQRERDCEDYGNGYPAGTIGAETR